MIETKFKHTDIGMVPVDWEAIKMNDILTVNSGISLPIDNITLNGYNVYGGNGLLPIKSKGYNAEDVIVVGRVGALCGNVHKINEKAWITDNALILNYDKSSINRDFLYLILDNYGLNKLSSGNAQPLITGSAIKNLCFFFPSISEQQRIASALMNIDALISNLDKLIAKKQAIKKGAMQELLTGKKRLPGFKGEWKEIKLGDLFNIKAGGDLDREHFSKVQNRIFKYPIFSNSFENHGLYGYTSKPKFKAKSITITGRGYLGHSEYREIPYDAIIRILVLLPKLEIDCYLISEIINFSHPFVLESTSIPQLTAPQVIDTNVYIPCDIDEQHAIAHVLSTMDSDISLLEQKRDKYRQIKQGMMHDLLTGRIRLTDKDSVERKGYTVGLHDHPFDGAIAAEPSPQ